MAENQETDVSEVQRVEEKPEEVSQDMDLETESHASENPNGENRADIGKRAREDEDEDISDSVGSKKPKVEKSAEEDRLEKLEECEVKEQAEEVGNKELKKQEDDEEQGNKEQAEENVNEELKKQEDNKEQGSEEQAEEIVNGELKKQEDGEEQVNEEQVKELETEVTLGPKKFSSSLDMFDYFYKFLHYWSPNVDINEYEHMVLLDLLKKGHLEPDKKIGEGIQAFQVRYHPMWKSRCFFIVRIDGFEDDFSFRKCVDNILPLPDNMKAGSFKNDSKKEGGNRKGGRGGHGGRGRGRGRRSGWRN